MVLLFYNDPDIYHFQFPLGSPEYCDRIQAGVWQEGREGTALAAGGSVASLAKLNTLPLFSLPGVDSAPAP